MRPGKKIKLDPDDVAKILMQYVKTRLGNVFYVVYVLRDGGLEVEYWEQDPRSAPELRVIDGGALTSSADSD